MIGFTTEIDLKKHEVRTTFMNQKVSTFAFDEAGFPLAEALKISAEDIHNQLLDFLAKLAEHGGRMRAQFATPEEIVALEPGQWIDTDSGLVFDTQEDVDDLKKLIAASEEPC